MAVLRAPVIGSGQINVHFAKCRNRSRCIIIKAKKNQVKLKKIRTSGQNKGVTVQLAHFSRFLQIVHIVVEV